MKDKIFLLIIIFALSFSVFAQDYSNLFSENDLRSTVKYLSDDGFEGRAPGSRGGELAAKYIANRLELAGIKPGNNGSFFQPVSLVGLKPDPNTVMNFSRISDGKSFDFNFGKDFVGFTDAQKNDVTVEGELVFVGYGIDAPEQNWNDYKGDASKYKDKILLMLVNDPPATEKEPNLFGGKALTYYGRWTYKYEEAARKGAKGVILIHTDSSAGYGWNVVENSFGGTERFDIARTENDKTPFLQMKAWMRDSSVSEFIKFSGTSLNSLMEKAKTRDFQSVELNTKVKVNLKAELQKVDSNNVIGIWEGSDAKLKDEYVVYTAHWDHLGVGKPNASGDKIYNGALDNASGVAQVIALAEAITKLPKAQQPKRSQVFLFVTAEEQGLLGSEWYAKNPIFQLNKTAANINIDGGNFYGKTRNYGALGAERSSLETFVNEELEKRSMKFMADNRPEQGSFFRSDHFPFAKMGVPALSIRGGDDFIGREKDWAEKFFADFNKNHYHQPSDEFRDDWQFDGMVQMLDATLAIGLRASNIEKFPAYKQSDEFAKAQPNRK
jgi:Zn-dependent M28 family amino/carboxypeptidase